MLHLSIEGALLERVSISKCTMISPRTDKASQEGMPLEDY